MNIANIISEGYNIFDVQKTKESKPSFYQFIWHKKKNRNFVWIALFVTIIQFITFKMFYPFADFFSDSYSYIYAASTNLKINIWPIGYSNFLRWFHFITHSDTALVSFQYFFLEISALYFFFTIVYFFEPSKLMKNILFVFLFFNPLFLYLSNYVNSDPLFAALSLIWFTQLLWIIWRPMIYQVVTHGVVLFLVFTVRNNAYYYPLITLIGYFLSNHRRWVKLVGFLFPAFMVILFISNTRATALKLTGTKQFSLFTGWQLANNALYMRGEIQVDSTNLPTKEIEDLDRLSRKYFRKTPNYREYLYSYEANFFIRQPESPLKQYFQANFRSTDEYNDIIVWGKASPIFETYGIYLIKHYPISFIHYFLLLNVKNYFLPPLEKLNMYNLGEDNIETVAQDWFDYKSNEVSATSKEFQGKLLSLYPAFFMLLNIYFLGGMIWFLLNKKVYNYNIALSSSIFLTAICLIINFFFCLFSTIIVLRYQIFPMIIFLAFSLLLIELMNKSDEKVKYKVKILEA